MHNDIHEKRFTSSEVAAAAGCREGTLRQWRFRHGLLGGTGATDVKYSLVDVCVVRAVQVLTTHGARISDAVPASRRSPKSDEVLSLVDDDLRAQITILLSDEKPFSTLFGFRLLEPDSKSVVAAAYMFQPEDLPKMLAEAGGGMFILDVMAVIDHVRAAPNIKEK